jgi:hypothetical protein
MTDVPDRQADRSARGASLAAWVFLLASFFFVASALHSVVLGDSANSRLATVYSLVHDGTWYIDRPLDQPPNPFEQGTIDKIELNGRILSTKPPLLPLAMTAEYAALKGALGWNLEVREHLKHIMQVMIFTLVMLPHAIGMIFFMLLLRLLVENPWQRLLPLAALAFATQLPGFATQLNNHSPAIGALLVALYFAIGVSSGKLAPTGWRFAAYGLAGALVFTLDMPLTIFVAAAGCGLLWKYPKQAVLWGGIGLVGPLAIHFCANYLATGSPLPVQTRKSLYLFESSAWRHPGGLDALHEPKGTYLFHMTFGRFGIFLLYPILLMGPLGCYFAWRDGMKEWRNYYLGGLACFAALGYYYVSGTNNYGGASYGFRWGMGAMPILILMGIPAFNRVRGPWAWSVVAVLMAVSMYSALECYWAPWGACHEWTCRWIFGTPYIDLTATIAAK